MSTSFRTRYPIIVRRKGVYIDGKYTGPVVMRRTFTMASVQPLNNAEYSRLTVNPTGRRQSSFKRVFSDDRFNVGDEEARGGAPGDLIVIEGEEYLFIDWAARNVLQSAASHNRYVAVRLLSRGPGEVGA